MTLKIKSEVWVDIYMANQQDDRDDGDNELVLGRWYVFINGTARPDSHTSETEAIQWVTNNRQSLVDVHGIAALPVEEK